MTNLESVSLKRLFRYSMAVIMTCMFFSACKKSETPENPYDSVNYNPNPDNDSVPSPSSITGLHKNIFSPKCAVPGCHDGTFEPDFRTVQSTFSTLVYMSVNKLTLDSVNFFNYRVIPGDDTASFLLERLLTPTSDYMPSNSVRLPDADIANIRKWINDGCPDVNGDLPTRPNLAPNVNGYIALNSSLVRIDTSRVDGVVFNPFIAPANSSIVLPVLVLDTADGIYATPPQNFTVHDLKFSTDKNNFSAATTITATWMSPIPYNVWQASVNTALWPVGTTVYFRVYMNDGFQASPAEFPRAASLDYYKTYFAFKIQ
jgi:hypothetical protein